MNNDKQKTIDDIILAGEQGITSYSSGLVRRGLDLANQILPDDHKNLELDDSRVATRTQSEIVQSSQTDDHSSDRAIDYTRLRDLLAAGNWKQADEETLTVIIKATGREQLGWLSSESVRNFSCTDLRTIDKLWVKYSNGRFGFSVQKRIWESVGRDYQKLGNCVGWREERMTVKWISYSKVTFDTSAPEGHLPVFFGLQIVGVCGGGWGWLGCLFSRIQTCQL